MHFLCIPGTSIPRCTTGSASVSFYSTSLCRSSSINYYFFLYELILCIKQEIVPSIVNLAQWLGSFSEWHFMVFAWVRIKPLTKSAIKTATREMARKSPVRVAEVFAPKAVGTSSASRSLTTLNEPLFGTRLVPRKRHSKGCKDAAFMTSLVTFFPKAGPNAKRMGWISGKMLSYPWLPQEIKDT